MSTIGLRIRELRTLRGWSAQRLCDEAHGAIARSTISELENGHVKDMSLTAALGVARALGMSVEQLAGVDIPSTAHVIAAEIAAARQRLDDELRSQ